ncbi:MAG: translation elongation factor Ts [Acholeplasmataceae bacterium]
MDMTLIKRLRAETGLSIVDIKKTLEKNNGDYDQTLKDLNALVKPQSSDQRVASKGAVLVKISHDQAIILEITAETDFASKNSHFLGLFEDVFELLLKSDIDTIESLEKASIDDITLSEHVKMVATKVSENISIRRFDRIQKNKAHVFGAYQHHDLKSACLVVLNQGNETFAKMIAMQAVAMDAQMIDQNNLDQQSIDKIKKDYESHPDGFTDFKDYLNSKSLLDQPYIHDQSQTVRAHLKQHQSTITHLIRYQLGEGIKDKLMCKLDLSQPTKISVTPILGHQKKT